MRPRSPHEPHRAATPLELLFDLVFVVAIAQAGSAFHHSISEQHAAQGLVSYAMVFFGIWWAWMNFTWFASAYDCDDVPYRLAVFVQITGALIFAAGVKTMFETQHLNLATVGGYVVMRLAAVTQWLRANASDPSHRETTKRMALGVSLCQLAWIGLLFAPQSWTLPGFGVFIVFELLVPVWAERAGHTTWHSHHIAERYGLFTIIVIGESILAATVAVQQSLVAGERLAALAPVIVGGLMIVYAMWWMYFYRPVHDLISHERLARAIVWGYGHYFVFASAAAVGAGLAVSVDQATHHTAISATAAGASVAIPAAIYLLSLWFLHYRPSTVFHTGLGPVAAVLVLLTPFTGQGVLLTGAILAAIVSIKLVLRHGQAAGETTSLG